MANLVPYKKPNTAIIKADKLLPRVNISSIVSKKDSPKLLESPLLKIERKVIKIDSLLKDSLLLAKKESEKSRIKKEEKKYDQREKELEKKKPKLPSGIKIPSLPGGGIFGWIKNFVVQTILGFITVRLIEHLPKLLQVLPVIIKVSDFFIDIGGKLLDGLVTFVDKAYDLVDNTRKFAKTIGGESLAQNFDKFAGAVDNVIEVAMIAALATADSGSGGDLLDLGKDFFKRKGVQQAAQTAGQQAAGTAARGAGLGAGAVTGIVAGAGLLASALGEGAFQVRKIAVKPIQNLENEYKKDKNPFTKIGRGVVLSMVRPLYGVFSTVGFLLDVVGAPFRYAIELLRFPFLSEEDKKKQANNLAKFDARIREDLRKALNMLTLGFAFKEKGSFGNIYGNKGAQKEMMSKMSGGGQPKTRGGKLVTGGSKRTIKKKKTRRVVSFTPTKIKPGRSSGGEDKIQKIFPNPEKPQGFLGFLGGLFGGGNQQQPQQSRQELPREKTINPQEFLVKSNDILGTASFFGPFFTIAYKTVLGDKPNKLDYMNVGKGLNAWMQGVFKSGPLGFAGGGEVDTKQFFEGEDYTNVIARSVEDSVSKEVNRTMVNLSKELSLKPVGREEMIQQNIQRGTEGTEPENLETAGGAVAASQLYKEIGANLEQWDIFRNSIALIESKGKYGIPGGSGMHYDGRYQMGEAAKKDGARVAGVSYPGHSSDPNAHVRVSFRNNPQLQETIFTGYTLANHRYLMRNPKYRSASVERKLQILGYAHNQGMGGAESWLTTGVVGADGFGTKGTKYTDLIARNFKAKKSGGQMQLAQGAVGVPSTSPGGVPSGNVSQKGLPPLPPTNTLPGKQHYGAPRRGGRRHAGVDFDAPDNGTFYSRIGGMVKYIGNEPGGYYKYVDIFNSQLGVTERIAEGDNILVRVGQNVSKGTPVARGTTTTGVFHYEIRRGSGTTYGFNGTVDPVKFLNSSSRSAFHGENFGIVQRDGFILKLHKGEMYKVVDKDTVDLLGFDLTKEIIDIENKSQLIAKTPSIIERLKTISGYTDYERPEPEIVYIPLGGEESTLVAGGSGGSTIVASASGDNYVNSSMEQTLAQIG